MNRKFTQLMLLIVTATSLACEQHHKREEATIHTVVYRPHCGQLLGDYSATHLGFSAGIVI